MTTIDELEAAAKRVNALPKSPGTSDMLELYALYKQGSSGDVQSGRPGMLDVRGRAKWDAWNGKKGMSQDAARDAYVALAKRLGAG
jgi:diazepam-binding inhibitor (GABA receptor modulating acyl-CoA-binding protein)